MSTNIPAVLFSVVYLFPGNHFTYSITFEHTVTFGFPLTRPVNNR